MRNITFYSSAEVDMKTLIASLKAVNLTGKFHLEKYRNPLRTQNDVHDFVNKFFESDIFVVGDYGVNTRDYIGSSMAIDLAVIKNTIRYTSVENYFVFF